MFIMVSCLCSKTLSLCVYVRLVFLYVFLFTLEIYCTLQACIQLWLANFFYSSKYATFIFELIFVWSCICTRKMLQAWFYFCNLIYETFNINTTVIFQETFINWLPDIAVHIFDKCDVQNMSKWCPKLWWWCPKLFRWFLIWLGKYFF